MLQLTERILAKRTLKQEKNLNRTKEEKAEKIN